MGRKVLDGGAKVVTAEDLREPLGWFCCIDNANTCCSSCRILKPSHPHAIPPNISDILLRFGDLGLK